jgi:hypothetical protein
VIAHVDFFIHADVSFLYDALAKLLIDAAKAERSVECG